MIVSGGGTGGHLFPGVAVANALQERHGAKVRFVGSRYGLERVAVPRAGYDVELLAVRGLRGKNPIEVFRSLAALLSSLVRANFVMRAFRPHLVVGLGGYAAFPCVLIALLRRVPVVLLEQNAQAGLTTRLLAWAAFRVCVSFEVTKERLGARAEVTGNPVRFSATSTTSRPETDPLRVLVFGGSAGARRLNEVVPGAIAAAKAGISVRHQAGGDSAAEVQERYASLGVEAEVVRFIDDMGSAYGWADLVICRAGATSIAELTVLGKPAILVPYPFAAGDHQTSNGQSMVDVGAAWMIADADLDATRLAACLDEIVRDRSQIATAARASRKLGRPGALDAVVEVCLAAARGEG